MESQETLRPHLMVNTRLTHAKSVRIPASVWILLTLAICSSASALTLLMILFYSDVPQDEAQKVVAGFFFTTVAAAWLVLLAAAALLFDTEDIIMTRLHGNSLLTHSNLKRHDRVWVGTSRRHSIANRLTRFGFSLGTTAAQSLISIELVEGIRRNPVPAPSPSHGEVSSSSTVTVTRPHNASKLSTAFTEHTEHNLASDAVSTTSTDRDTLIESTKWSPKAPRRSATWPHAYLPAGVSPYGTPANTLTGTNMASMQSLAESHPSPLTPPRIDSEFWLALTSVSPPAPLNVNKALESLGSKDSLELHRERMNDE